MKSYKTLLIILLAVEAFIDIFLIIRIGLIPTVAIFVITGVIGFFVAKKSSSGLQQYAMNGLAGNAQMGPELLGKLCIVFAGLFLMIPGFITDIIALALLFKPTRKMLEPMIMGLLFKIAQNVDQSMLQKARGGYTGKW